MDRYRIYTRLYVRRADKSEVLSEANSGEFIDVTPISRPNYGSFSFTPLRHVFVVNISRIWILLTNVQNKMECIEVKKIKIE